jgi:hypothetical protein
MGVAGAIAIVAQDEVLVFSQDLRPPGVVALVECIRFLELFVIDKDVFSPDLHVLSWQPDDSLDEISTGIPGIVEDHDISACGRVEMIHKLVDDQILPIVQVWLHADSLDAESLDQRAGYYINQEHQEHGIHDLAQDRLPMPSLILFVLIVNCVLVYLR